MTAASATFELTLQSTTAEDSFRVVAEWSCPGALPVRREHEVVFAGADKSPLLLEASSAKSYGTVLGGAIFAAGVRDLFAQARAAGPTLHVLLAIEAKRAQTMRWERLCAPFEDERWELLGAQQRTPFSLYLPSTTDRLFPPFGRMDLKALVVIASPEAGNSFGVGPFDDAAALATALGGLGEIPSVVLGSTPGAAGPPTLAAICAQLTAQRFTILHLICHGALGKSGETAVFLHGDEGKVAAVRATDLIDRLRELGSARGLPHLAFLSVCDSAKPEAEAAFGGLGQRLVRELGMPAVVAMTEKISQATALALGQAFYPRLRDHGEADRALSEACVEVRKRFDAVVPALFSRLVGRPLFSDDLDRPLTGVEVSNAAAQVETLFAERAPSLLPRARALAAAVNVDAATLAGPALTERAATLAELQQLCEQALEVSFSALAHGRKAAPYQVACPFPGLAAFTAGERRFFRGRDALVETLLAQLRRQSLLAVLGNSGSGKSSLVMAGVIPRFTDETPGLKVAQMKPGHRPCGALDAALGELGGAAHSILYVDQFEETFTRCSDLAERRAFLDTLLAAATPQHKVIVSMRADFIGDCADHKRLREQVEGLKLVPPMSADELRNAVEEQGKEAGLRFETGLCELILEDLRDEPGAMPLLQHALRELYERRHGRWLRVGAYDELGRVSRAITRTAEGVWGRLDVRDRERLQQVMLELTEVSDAQGGGPPRYTRRRVELANLYAASPADEPSIRRLVNLLTDDRLLVKSRDDKAGDVVEVAHEALLRGWERLQEWLAASRDAIRLRKDIESASAGWRANDKAHVYLEHVRERGELVRSFLRQGTLKLDPAQGEYFAACEAEERRELQEREAQQRWELEAARRLAETERRAARRQRVFTVVAGGIGLVAILAAVGALVARAQARQSAALAQRNAERAEVSRQEAHERLLASLEEQARSAWLRGSPSLALLYAERARAEGSTSVVISSTLALASKVTIDAQVAIIGGARSGVALSTDGKLLLLAGVDRTGRLFDLEDAAHPRQLGTLAGHLGNLECVALSTDGKLAATGGRDNAARVWNLSDPRRPQLIATLPHGDAVNGVMFNPQDGKRLLTACADGSAAVWDVSASAVAKPIRLFSAGAAGAASQAVAAAVWSPDGGKVATAAGPTIRLWRADRGQLLHTLSGHAVDVNELAFSADGNRLVSGSDDRTARLWDVAGGREVMRIEDQGAVKAVAFDATGDRLVTAGGGLRVWDIHDRKEARLLVSFEGHEDAINSALFSPDGRLLVTASEDRTARIWRPRSGPLVGVIAALDDAGANAASFNPRRRWVVIAATNTKAQLFDVTDEAAPTPLRPLGGHQKELTFAGFSPDGNRLVTASGDGLAKLWDVTTLETARRTGILAGHEGAVTAARFRGDGKRLVTASADTTARLWDVSDDANPQLVAVLGGEHSHEQEVWSAAFSRDGKRVVTASQDKRARIWDPGAPGRPIGEVETDAPVYCAAFSPDGERLAIAAGSRALVFAIADPAHPQRQLTLERQGGDVLSITFSHDGQRLLTGGIDKTARLWDATTGRLIAVFAGHAAPVKHVEFNLEDDRALSASLDGTVGIWDVHLERRAPAQLAELLRCRVPLHWEGLTVVAGRPDTAGCAGEPAPAAPPAVAATVETVRVGLQLRLSPPFSPPAGFPAATMCAPPYPGPFGLPWR